MQSNKYFYLNEIYASLIEVDGQKLYKFTEKGVSFLLSLKNDWLELGFGLLYYMGAPLIVKMLEKRNISLAIGLLHSKVFYFLYEDNGEIFRITPERIKCLNCSWVGYGANTNLSDNRIGLPQTHIRLFYSKIEKLQYVGCPQCGSQLYRNTILFTLDENIIS